MHCILRLYFGRSYLYVYHILLKIARSATCIIAFYFTPVFNIRCIPTMGKTSKCVRTNLIALFLNVYYQGTETNA